MNKYIGITIGPIIKTIMKAKKTRELFAASYILSYIMKKIIIELKERTFILPHFEKDVIETKKYEIGIFPDRMIFCSENGDFKQLKKIIERILLEISEAIYKHTTKRLQDELRKEKNQNRDPQIKIKLEHYYSISKDTLFEYLNNYFRIYYCEIETEKNYNEVINEINSYLDTFELQQKYIPMEIYDYLSDFFFRVNHSFLMSDAFTARHTFKSIPEIATSELRINLNEFEKFEDDDTDFYKHLEKENENFKQYHKYIAIVGADADNMGKTINSLNEIGEYNKLSENLYDFALNANEKIKDFGGATIYAGGDDLLFFAPVVGKDKRNFVQLIDELSNEFYCRMQHTLSNLPTYPTLSFGISLGYYKFPMNEILENTHSLLNTAKNILGKNAIAYRVLKHSGKYFEGSFSKYSNEYNVFKALLFSQNDASNPEKFINSFSFKLADYEKIIMEIGKDEERLKHFFYNNFNESAHNEARPYIDKVREFVHSVIISNSKEDKIRQITSFLRLVKFLKGDKQ